MTGSETNDTILFGQTPDPGSGETLQTDPSAEAAFHGEETCGMDAEPAENAAVTADPGMVQADGSGCTDLIEVHPAGTELAVIESPETGIMPADLSEISESEEQDTAADTEAGSELIPEETELPKKPLPKYLIFDGQMYDSLEALSARLNQLAEGSLPSFERKLGSLFEGGELSSGFLDWMLGQGEEEAVASYKDNKEQ